MLVEKTITPTLHATAIAASNKAITGVFEVNCNGSATPAIIDELVIIDVNAVNKALDILFFQESPATPIAAGATVTYSAADSALLSGVVRVAASDYSNLGVSVADFKNLLKNVKLKNKESFFCQLVLRDSAATYTASGLVLKFYFQ